LKIAMSVIQEAHSISPTNPSMDVETDVYSNKNKSKYIMLMHPSDHDKYYD
jgi:hypothetical protein